MGSFHAYPSSPQAIVAYSRAIPLQCDTVEYSTLTKGYFDTANHCFVAVDACVMQFHANVLLDQPADGSCINVWLMKNTLPPPGGSIGGEIAGDDVPIKQAGNGSMQNATARVTRQMSLQPGDRVYAVPGINGGGALTGSIAANGNNTCNYFEGVEIS